MDYIVVFITTPTVEEAQRLATALLGERQAACVNIVPRVNSTFWWQDKLDVAQESLLVVKTKAERLDDIVAQVKRLHSYQVPEVIALPIVGGNQDYLDWLGREVK